MFTGIVEEIGIVEALSQVAAGGWSLTVRAHTALKGARLGDSLAINGTCLTVTALTSDSFTVGLSPETLRRTNLGDLRANDEVNLERSLAADGHIGGHFVQGHVDGTGVAADDIDIAWTPGAFEIPLVAKRMAEGGRYNAIVCLGVIIRGATAHFEYVAGQTASGITAAALATGVSVLFGVLTTENIEQAVERAGTKAGNKGAEAAMAAIEMANLLRALEDAG